MANKHNQYVAVPDWFQSHEDVKTKETETVVQTGVISSGGSGGIGELILYNKFVLEPLELEMDDLTEKDEAIVAFKVDDNEVGTIVSAEGWARTKHLAIAANTEININSFKHESYGIVFYNYNFEPVSSALIELSAATIIQVPKNAYYFIVCCSTDYSEFFVEYQSRIPYDADQLETVSNNREDFTSLNADIPEGISINTLMPTTLSFLVESPMALVTDKKDVVKLSLDYKKIPGSWAGDMFEWDKKYAAKGFDPITNTAYSYTDELLDITIDENGNEVPVTTSDQTKWMLDEEKEDQWIIKTTRQRFSILEGLMEFDKEKDCFFFHKNIATSGGITQYAQLDDIDVGDIYDGLSLDNRTITWMYDETGKNKVLTVIDNTDVNNKFVTRQEWETFLGNNDTDTLINTWNDLLDFLTGMTEGTTLLNFFNQYAHKKKNETIEGLYNFVKGIKINSKHLQYDAEKNVWLFEGNIAATGGVTMYYDDSFQPDATILDAINVVAPLYKEDNYLKIDESAIGGGISNLYGGTSEGTQFVYGMELSEDGKTITVLKRILTIADIPDLKSLYVDLKTDQTINGLKNFTTSIRIGGKELWDLYVDRSRTQTINGWKEFLDGIRFEEGGLSMYKSSTIDDTVYLDANLVVRGGITQYGYNTASDVPNILDAIPIAGYSTPGLAAFNSDDFTLSGGVVSLIDKGTDELDNKLVITVGNGSYTYDASQYVTVPINYTTLGLDSRYLQLTNIVTELNNKHFRQIQQVRSSSSATSSGILYIII